MALVVVAQVVVAQVAFCLGRQALKPATDLSFFQFRVAVNLFSLGLFLIMYNRMVDTIPSSFLLHIIIYQGKFFHFLS